VVDHANRGVGWERLIEGWHDTYRRDRQAVVFRTPPPVKLLSKVSGEGQFRACFRSEGPPDYAGVLKRRVPVAVAFDAKDCETTRWSFGALERHQARDLEGWAGVGGYAFVALRFAEIGWVLPWSELGPAWWAWHEREGRAVKGTAGLDLAGVRAMGLRMPMPGDWLGALRAGGVV
jgi:penicillin-binding protein-related factor A (putative recombinase)